MAAAKRAALFSLEASSLPKTISFLPDAEMIGSLLSSAFSALEPLVANLAARAALASSLVKLRREIKLYK